MQDSFMGKLRVLHSIPALLIALGCYIFWSEIFLTWDASFQLYEVIKTQRPGIMPWRWIMYLHKIPATLYVQIAGNKLNLQTLVNVYGVYFSLFPLLVFSWLWIRARNNLEVLFFCTTCMFLPTALYGYHLLAEHLQLTAIAWVLLATLASAPQKKLGLGVCIFVAFFTHPASSVLFALLAGLYVLKFFLQGLREDLWLGASFFGLTVSRALLLFEVDSDTHAVSSTQLAAMLEASLDYTPPIIYVMLMSGIFMTLILWASMKYRNGIFSLALLLIPILAIPMLHQDLNSVISAANLRHLMMILHTPLIVLFFVNFIILKKSYSPEVFKAHALLAILGYVVIMVSIGQIRLNEHKTIHRHYSDLGITCIENWAVYKNTLPFGHFASPFEWFFYFKTKNPPFLVLSHGNDCRTLRSQDSFQLRLYDKRLETIDPHFSHKALK